MEVIIVIYLKVRPLTLCRIQTITIIPITNMNILHYIYVHLQSKCKYFIIDNRYFQPVKMNYKLKSSTSTNINESQAKIQLPLVWNI
jgi:hypothetical protein